MKKLTGQSTTKGGLCGYIDTGFKEVVPVKYPYEQTPKPK